MTPSLTPRFGLLGLLALFSAPFLVAAHSLPIPSFYVEWSAMLCGLIALTVLFVRREARLELPRIVWLPLGLCALLLGQASLGLVNYPSQAVLAVLYLLWATALMLATRRLAQIWDKPSLSSWLAWAVLAGGLVNVFVAALQFIGADAGLPFIVRARPGFIYGNLAQANHFADYLALAFASLLFLFAQNRLRLRFAAPLYLLLLASLTLSGSRSVWLYLLAFTMLALWLFRRSRTAEARRILVAATIALPLFFGLQLGFDALGVLTASRRLAELAGSVSIRLVFWQDAWAMFTNAPWQGIGYQQYPWQHFQRLLTGSSPLAAIPRLEGLYAEHAHNIVLHLLAEFGVAVIPLLAWAGWCLYTAVRATASAWQWWLVALLTVLTIHSLLEYPLWFANFLGVAAVAFALADPRPYSFAVPVASLRRLSTLFVLGGAAVLALLWFGYVAIEQMILAWHNARTPQTVALIQHNLRFAQTATLLEPQLDAFLASLPVESKDQDALQERVTLSAKVVHQMTNAPAVYRHVAWLWLAGQKTEALALLDKAVRAYPASRERNVEELQRMAKSYPEIEPLLQAARSAQASAAPLPANAATPAAAGMFRPPGYRTTP